MKKALILLFAITVLIVLSISVNSIEINEGGIGINEECSFMSPFVGIVNGIAKVTDRPLVIPILDNTNFVSLGYKLGTGENKYINMELDQRVLEKYLDNEDDPIFPKLFRGQDNFKSAPGIPEQLAWILKDDDVFMQTKTETDACGSPFMRSYNKKGDIKFLYSNSLYPFKFKDLIIAAERGEKLCFFGGCEEKINFTVNDNKFTLAPGPSAVLNKHGVFS